MTSIAAATHMGAVTLDVAQLDTMIRFYTDGVGLELITNENGVATLGRNGIVLMVLRHAPGLKHAGPREAGLFHTAILFDTEPGQIFAELGLFGFLAWYGLRFYIWIALWTSFRRSPPGILKTISLSAFLVYGPYMIMSVVLNHTANILLWALVGLSFTCRLQPTVQRRFANPRMRSGQAPLPLRGRRV